MSIRFISLTLGPIETNCYIVFDDTTKEAMVIDPAWDYKEINRNLEEHDLQLKLIFLTHGHADHIGALQELRILKNVPVYIGAGDQALIANSHNNLSVFMGKKIECTAPDCIAHDGDVITVGKLQFHVLETPGHTPGGLSLYGESVVFSGDTLFLYSVGRTDLYGGSMATLLDSINNKLLTLPDETVVLPGHGPATQIGRERQNNPYLDGGW